MNAHIVQARNTITRTLYSRMLKPVLFRSDPEKVHDAMVRLGLRLGQTQIGKKLTQTLFFFEDTSLEQVVHGIRFKNPIGLSAGFDKNGELTDIMPSVGFGFVEIGSVTGNRCTGNQIPRLWRLPKSKSLVVNYGLKNNGCEEIAKKLQGKYFSIPVGVNVAMTNCEETLNLRSAVKDFEKAFRVMSPIGDYVTVNISCPNTRGGQQFIQPHKLDYLLDILDEVKVEKPIFIKLSPDLSREQIDAILAVAKQHRVHGIICTNLTKPRDNPNIIETDIPPNGGISGKAVQDLSDKLLKHIYKKEGARFVLVGSGGVSSAEDAYRKIRLGASLVQLITGMIYEGPQLISEINLGLVQLLKRNGFQNINQAIGVDSK
jgi:dihydroorotate dehydrogenase